LLPIPGAIAIQMEPIKCTLTPSAVSNIVSAMILPHDLLHIESRHLPVMRLSSGGLDVPADLFHQII